jgi:hypothetical protein
LNRYIGVCSAFLDVDAPFGSVGSFFAPNFAPSRGCYEANPPFVPKVMELMVKKLERLLASPHAAALSFVVIVPAWSQLPYWKALEASQVCTYVCPHTAIYVSSCCSIHVLILLYMCPHAAIHVS